MTKLSQYSHLLYILLYNYVDNIKQDTKFNNDKKTKYCI